jgi:cyclopropane-fatty-acyl-phospholipid synthase
MLLATMLSRLVRQGRLTVIDAAGQAHVFGSEPGPAAAVRLRDRAIERDLLLSPELSLAEGFMDQRIELEGCTLYELLDLLVLNLGMQRDTWLSEIKRKIMLVLRYLHQHNPIGRAQANIEHHYDLSDELYALFLDADRQYSCAYFPTPDVTLEQAQHAKKRHLAAKLLASPGQRVLDIGSGWGGLGLSIARDTGADVTGVTLSKEQHKVSNERAQRAGLGERVRFLLKDYRELDGRFDRIVSVGMFEHVGVRHFAEYFSKAWDLLADDGVMVLHSIGRMSGPGHTSPFIRKHIFPGGYIPALSEVIPVIERQGFWITDVEILRLHYAETLRHWRQRFMANRDKAKALYDERFCRMWEFYLVGSELFFRRQDGMIFQIQLAKDRHAVPLTRDYITDWERENGHRMDRAA